MSKNDEMRAKVGQIEPLHCPICKKETKHFFCEKTVGMLRNRYEWFWECSVCQYKRIIYEG
jgi:C4-type Zn-finger protein